MLLLVNPAVGTANLPRSLLQESWRGRTRPTLRKVGCINCVNASTTISLGLVAGSQPV
jgi:hypothetical protein